MRANRRRNGAAERRSSRATPAGDAPPRRARAERTTLNEEFRKWLADYAQRRRRADAALAVLAELRARVRTGGRRFTREEMHER